MKFRGRDIDPVAFWSEYVDFPPNMREDGQEFSPLVHCPNPAHDNFNSPAFQVNLRLPLVHCFSRCGIEGNYEHAVALIHGLYEKYKVSEAKTPRERVSRIRKAKNEAKKMILRGAKPSVFKTVGVEPRPIAKAKRLSKLAWVKADGAGSLTIRLEPPGTITGRVVDARGRPLAGLSIALDRNHPNIPARLRIINPIHHEFTVG